MLDKSLVIALIYLSVSLAFGQAVQAQDNSSSTFLKGNVQESEYLKRGGGPSLSRSDLKRRSADPFLNGEVEKDAMFSPPESAFQVESMKPPPPQRQFPLRAEQEGDNFTNLPMLPLNGMSEPPYVDMAGQEPQFASPNQGAGPPPQMQPPMPQPSEPDPNDPDSSREMQLLWDAWHHRVAEEVYKRINFLAQTAFRFSPPLAARISYTVTRDHRIVNTQLTQKSPSVAYNIMVVGVVNSMNGNPLLEFPPGSRRMSVDKTGTFTHRYGHEGFRYTTGDRETIKMR